VLAEAAEDIEQARDFYDIQEPGVGDYFTDSILADIESVVLRFKNPQTSFCPGGRYSHAALLHTVKR
jgi:hypothetical protein